MISRYLFRVASQTPLPADRAYAFYSCLLSLLPEEYAGELHEPKETPISQCLYGKNGEMFWQIHLLDPTADNLFSAVLDDLTVLPLHSGEVGLDRQEKETLTAEDLMKAARNIQAERFFSLRFLSPVAFRRGGRYTVLPEKDLILQSLQKKWNGTFPACPLDDEDAFRLLAEGIQITDYHLRTTRFSLKDNRIPGFIGNLCVETRLSAPILEIWKLLIAFSEYSGLGIKTALGMGGVKLCSK